MIIHIVFGESGECSGMQRWMVKAFRDSDKAKMLMVNAQRETDALFFPDSVLFDNLTQQSRQ